MESYFPAEGAQLQDEQPQVDTEERSLAPAGRFAALALRAFPGVSNAYFTFILASAFVVKHAFRALQQPFPSCRLIKVLDDLRLKIESNMLT